MPRHTEADLPPQCQYNSYFPTEEKQLCINARRDTVEPQLMEQLKCMKKQDLKKLDRCDRQNEAFVMMRSLLPATVTDDMIQNEARYIANTLRNAAVDFIKNPNYRPCRKSPTHFSQSLSSQPSHGNVPYKFKDAMDSIIESDDVIVPDLAHNDVIEHVTVSLPAGSHDTPVDLTQSKQSSNAADINVSILSQTATSDEVRDPPTAPLPPHLSATSPLAALLPSSGSNFPSSTPLPLSGSSPLHPTAPLPPPPTAPLLPPPTPSLGDTAPHQFDDRCLSTHVQVAALRSEVRDLHSVIAQLVSSNELLVSKMNSVLDAKSVNAHTSTPAPTQRPSGPKLPALLIGDSMVREMHSLDEKDIHIISQGGAKTGNIRQTLAKTKTDSHGDIFVHVGTNDCSTKFPVDKIKHNVRNIILESKRVSVTGCITLSAVCPRYDNLDAAAKSKEVNECIESLAVEEGCTYISHDNHFHYQNGDLNKDLYMLDGLHLSDSGSKRLLANMSLDHIAVSRHGHRVGERSSNVGHTRPRDARNSRASHAAQHTSRNAWNTRDTPGGHTRDRTPTRGDVRERSRERSRERTYRDSHTRTRDDVRDDRNRSRERSRDRTRRDSHTQGYSDTPRRPSERDHSEQPRRDIYTNSQTYQNRQRDDFCTQCGEDNHASSSCRYHSKLECYSCNHMGHKEKFCYMYKRH